jgi:hypothetical protein
MGSIWSIVRYVQDIAFIDEIHQVLLESLLQRYTKGHSAGACATKNKRFTISRVINAYRR